MFSYQLYLISLAMSTTKIKVFVAVFYSSSIMSTDYERVANSVHCCTHLSRIGIWRLLR